jgi:hypothetical protein
VEVGILHQHHHSFPESAFAVVDVVHSLTLLDPEDFIKIMIMKIAGNRRVEKATGKVVMLPCGHKSFQREPIHGKNKCRYSIIKNIPSGRMFFSLPLYSESL